ncbi:MAG: BlaI/MecI/CopY family transcriptional regulator, partial [Flavobacteriales bacterium]|nr:BlaI/MecI/CopY family transcriptional regulator [Flavobacteriales bacterium]
MERLTPAEEQVMQALWDKGRAFVKELLEDMPEPKPAYTTVSTIVRILEQKG